MDLAETLQNLLGQVPELVQPLIVAIAGAIPFIEGEGGAAIGILGGVNPVVAAIAAMAGNFLVVTVLVLLGSGARDAVVTRHREKVLAHAGAVLTRRRDPSGSHGRRGIDAGRLLIDRQFLSSGLRTSLGRLPPARHSVVPRRSIMPLLTTAKGGVSLSSRILAAPPLECVERVRDAERNSRGYP